MNRIKLSPLATAAQPQAEAARPSPSEFFSLSKSVASTLPEKALFVPLHYEPKYAYPLVVWLHSDGQQASQLESVMAQMSMRNFAGVAPQASVGNFHCGFFWEQDYDSIESADEAVQAAIAHARSRLNIHDRRIFLVGSEGGGTMALRLALRHPERFAGVASLNGRLPEGHTPLSRWDHCRKLPVFWSHHLEHADGSDWVGDQFRFLYSTGFLNLSIREYPSQGHLNQLAPAAVNRWIMEQIDSAIV